MSHNSMSTKNTLNLLILQFLKREQCSYVCRCRACWWLVFRFELRLSWPWAGGAASWQSSTVRIFTWSSGTYCPSGDIMNLRIKLELFQKTWYQRRCTSWTELEPPTSILFTCFNPMSRPVVHAKFDICNEVNSLGRRAINDRNGSLWEGKREPLCWRFILF